MRIFDREPPSGHDAEPWCWATQRMGIEPAEQWRLYEQSPTHVVEAIRQPVQACIRSIASHGGGVWHEKEHAPSLHS
jgi:hypothetical protein